MGQRSQIYVKVNTINKDGTVDTHLTATYYQWNYKERMVSRARHITDWVRNHVQYWSFEKEKLKAFMKVNIDMEDVVDTTDILEETIEWLDYKVPTKGFNEDIFYNQDNNDGQFFLEVTYDDENDCLVGCKYAFVTAPGSDDPIDVYDYLSVYADKGWRKDKSSKDFFMEVAGDIFSYEIQHGDFDITSTAWNNAEELSKMAELMTREELLSFIEFDYTEQLKSIRKNVISKEYGKLVGMRDLLGRNDDNLNAKIKMLKEMYNKEEE